MPHNGLLKEYYPAHSAVACQRDKKEDTTSDIMCLLTRFSPVCHEANVCQCTEGRVQTFKWESNICRSKPHNVPTLRVCLGSWRISHPRWCSEELTWPSSGCNAPFLGSQSPPAGKVQTERRWSHTYCTSRVYSRASPLSSLCQNITRHLSQEDGVYVRAQVIKKAPTYIPTG